MKEKMKKVEKNIKASCQNKLSIKIQRNKTCL